MSASDHLPHEQPLHEQLRTALSSEEMSGQRELIQQISDSISEASQQLILDLLLGIAILAQEGFSFDKSRLSYLLQAVALRFGNPDRARVELDDSGAEIVSQLITAVDDSAIRERLLLLLVHSGRDDDLKRLAVALVHTPPADPRSVGLIVGILMQREHYDPACLFPTLLDGLKHPQVAAPVLDLANFLTRKGLASPHPAAERREMLADLLRDITQNLLQLESDPGGERTNEELQTLVVESISIVVAVCDALAQIGDRKDIGRIRQVLQLRHRRLQTEAAAALARFGEEEGQDALIELVKEPVTRLRVLAYADELGLSDRIEDQFATDEARAEAELALWLAQPENIGFPPSSIELVDHRVQFWPGFNEPVDCYLFRYVYGLNDSVFDNVALVGPITHSMRPRLVELPEDDVYAIFAGWYAEHEDIFELDIDRSNPAHQADLARMERRLVDRGFDDVTPICWGSFLGDRVLLASANRDNESGHCVVDALDVLWMPSRSGSATFSEVEAYQLYKGRKLLRSFNEG